MTLLASEVSVEIFEVAAVVVLEVGAADDVAMEELEALPYILPTLQVDVDATGSFGGTVIGAATTFLD